MQQNVKDYTQRCYNIIATYTQTTIRKQIYVSNVNDAGKTIKYSSEIQKLLHNPQSILSSGTEWLLDKNYLYKLVFKQRKLNMLQCLANIFQIKPY